MSWDFYFEPEYKAPFRSDDVEESCLRAYNYFPTLVDDFIARLPEHRHPQDFNQGLRMSHPSLIL